MLRRQIKVLTAEGRLSAWVLAILPIAIGLYMAATNPDYIGLLVTTTIFRGLAGGAMAGASIGTMIAPGIGTAIGAGVGAIAGLVTGLFGGGAKRRAEEAARRAALLEQQKFGAPETITRYALAGEVGAIETDLTGQVRGIGRVPTVIVNVSNQMIDARHAREAGDVIGQEVSRQILSGGGYLADNIAWAAGAP